MHFFATLGHFLHPFTPLTTQKIIILKNWKKHLEKLYSIIMSHVHFRVNPHSIVCLNVKELLARSRYLVLVPILAWIMLLSLKPGEIIILCKCTKNHGHMLHCSCDRGCGRCNNYFSFWAIFCPFTPLTAQKTKILEKWKKKPPFYICVMITWCRLWSYDKGFLR